MLGNLYLGSDRIFNADDKYARQIVDDVVLVIPVGFVVVMDLINLGLARHEIAVSHSDCAQAIAGHRLNNFPNKSILHFASEFLQFSISAVNEGAPLHNYKRIVIFVIRFDFFHQFQ